MARGEFDNTKFLDRKDAETQRKHNLYLCALASLRFTMRNVYQGDFEGLRNHGRAGQS